jgi:hypothetical protein
MSDVEAMVEKSVAGGEYASAQLCRSSDYSFVSLRPQESLASTHTKSILQSNQHL